MADGKGMVLWIGMLLVCLFHGSDCVILVTRAKQHIGNRPTWSRGFESSQDTRQIRRVGRVLLIVDDVEIVARGHRLCGGGDLSREYIVGRVDRAGLWRVCVCKRSLEYQVIIL